MNLELAGKVALVTGSSRGIGKAEALALAEDGVNIIINYIRNEEAAHQVAESVRLKGRESLVVKADVTKSKEVEYMVEKSISRFGKIDILVNNAGIAGEYIGKSIVDMTEDEWNMVVETSLKGTFLVTKYVAREMIKRKEGRIINTSSVYGQSGGRPGVANYASAKSGIIGFTKTAALELSKYGVTVNAISPGFIETELARTLPIKDDLVKQIPLRRFGKPEEIGRMIAFLASPHAAYITGSVVEVNGGRIEFQFP